MRFKSTRVIHIGPDRPRATINAKFHILALLSIGFFVIVVFILVLLFFLGCLNGTCTRGVNKYNACASSPCRNGGNCTNGFNRYTCTCAAGYIGSYCGVNVTECASSQCKNRGNCTNSVNGLPCTCAAGYSGINCDVNINECASNPCQNGGKCVDAVNGYACTCAGGYRGAHCEKDIDECASMPCGINSLGCSNLINDYNCTCKAGYGGKRCLAQCLPGTFSPSGVNETSSPCQPCAKDTYSNLGGSTECKPCPNGKNTTGVGSQNSSMCFLPPNINRVSPSNEILSKVGDDLTLECYFAAANPKPKTKWQKIGASLPAGSMTSDVLNIDLIPTGMILEMTSLKVNDSGTYKCAVQNSVGTHSSSFKLTVS